ncbi:hypothetical protein APA386B_2206 [Acetobacter pasteurianus 386B]|nr:hypothetical protein APA386B_2206 [Acetobacter pasteurianus 386B]
MVLILYTVCIINFLTNKKTERISKNFSFYNYFLC